MDNDIYTLDQVAKKLQMSTATIRKLINEHKFPYTNVSRGKLRKIYRVTNQQLKDWLEENKNE